MNSVLIDFDGVVFNNKQVFKHINDRSVDYIANRLSISKSVANRINTINYKKNGHTIFATNTDVHDYNNFVFNTKMLNDILYINYDEKDTLRLTKLVQKKNELNLDLVLCTNAPFRYCERILNLSGFAMSDVFSTSFCYTSDALHSVKPSDTFFDKVQNEMKGPICFFDDSLLNIVAARKNTDWQPVLFDSNDHQFDILAQ